MPAPSPERRVLRLFRCLPVELGFDRILRDILVPDLLTLPAVSDVIVGRQGPGEMGERLVASVWETSTAMLESMGRDVESSSFHPERLPETRDRTLEVVPLAVHLRWPDHEAPAIVRLSHGSVVDGGLERYVEAARAGAEADHQRLGSAAFYLGTPGPADFVTLSVWPSWAAIAAATGADIRRPIATRHGDLIADFRAEHLEVVPMVSRPSAS